MMRRPSNHWALRAACDDGQIAPACPAATECSTGRRWTLLAATLCGVLAVWGVVLPRLSAVPHVADHIATQQRLGIDPSALFYTELKISAGIAHRQERRQQHSRAGFWRPSPRWHVAPLPSGEAGN